MPLTDSGVNHGVGFIRWRERKNISRMTVMESFKQFLSKFNPKNDINDPRPSYHTSEDEIAACEATIYAYVHRDSKVSAPQLIDALHGITKSGIAALVYAVTQVAAHPDGRVRRQAWKTIEALLVDVPCSALPAIGYEMRRQGVDLDRYFQGAEMDMPAKAIGMLTFNKNGFIRENALRELMHRFDGKELPFIIIAANDWVGNIHVLATEALEKRANKQYAPYLAENLALFRWLWETKRHEFGLLRTNIEALISETLSRSDLPGIFSTDPDRRSWFYAFKLALEAPNRSVSEFDQLIDYGISIRDIRIQTFATERALKQFSPEKLGAYIPRLLEHSLPQVRREALRWTVDNKWDNYENTLETCLFDRSISVRLLAQYCMEKSKIIPLYLENLRTQAFPIDATLRGLVEMKAEIPKEVLEPFLAHQSSKVRAAAYTILLNENSSNTEQLTLKAISEKSGYCTRVALKFLRHNRHTLNADQLWELYSPDAPIANTRAVLNALANLGSWRSLEYLFLAKKSARSEIQDNLDYFISKWEVVPKDKLSSEQFERCMSAIAKCKGLIAPDRIKHFEFVLNSTQRS